MLKGLYISCMMRRFALLAVALAAVAQPVWGQDDELGRPRGWRRGPLRMEDFGTGVGVGKQQSHLEFGIRYSMEGVTEGRDTYRFCRTSAVVYPAASWMSAERRGELELVYNQTQFDMVELYARLMQVDALKTKGKKNIAVLAEETRERLERELGTLRAATDYGRDSAVVERVRQHNLHWLKDNPLVRPDFEPRASWWQLDMETNLLFSAGGLGSELTPAVGGLGYSIGRGWSRLGLYLSYLNNTVYFHEDSPYGRVPVARVDLDLGIGYAVVDRNAFRLTPYVAAGLSSVDSYLDGFWADGVAATIGVRGYYHFHHWHLVTNGAKRKARCETVSLSANLFVSRVIYSSEDDGNFFTVGLRFGIGLNSRAERVSF